jgi:hypothetical protein
MKTAKQAPDSPSAETPKFPPSFPTFGVRLRFVREFVAELPAQAMAELLGFAPSTYATWEAGKRPRDKVEVADAVGVHFGADAAEWLLKGGPLHLFPKCDRLRDVSHSPRLPFKLPPARTEPTLTVA